VNARRRIIKQSNYSELDSFAGRDALQVGQEVIGRLVPILRALREPSWRYYALY